MASLSRRVSFDRAARVFLNSLVRVTDGGSVIADNLRASIQPRTAYSVDGLEGRYTDATVWMFCHAESGNRVKLKFRRGTKVEDLRDGVPFRVFEVTDEPENFDGVFLAVPMRPRRMGAE